MAKKTDEKEIIIGVTKKNNASLNSKKSPNGKKKPNNKKVQNSKKKPIKNKKVVEKKVISEEEREKIRKKRKRIIFTIKFGMLGVLLITVILCAMFSPLFNIKDIKVEGNEKISTNEIISLAQIQLEENTFKLSKNKIKKQIKQNAYIGEVNITRKLPSNIIIKVEERIPAYLLEYAGEYIYLDKQGYMLEISQEKLELPILQGENTLTEDFIVGNRLCTQDLEALSYVDKIMELAEINDMASIITRIDIENTKNLILMFETKEKTAYLGDSSNLNTKILTIKSVLEREEGKAGEIFVNMDLNKEYPVFRERV